MTKDEFQAAKKELRAEYKASKNSVVEAEVVKAPTVKAKSKGAK